MKLARYLLQNCANSASYQIYVVSRTELISANTNTITAKTACLHLQNIACTF